MRMIRPSLASNDRQNNVKENSSATRITYRVLFLIIVLSLCAFAVLAALLMRGLCFVREWLIVVFAGIAVTAAVGLTLPFFRSRARTSRQRTVLTVVSVMLILTAASITFSVAQIMAVFGHTPLAYFETADGKYRIVLMQNTMVDEEDGSQYIVLSAYPSVGKFFLMTESDTAYVKGLKSVNWKAEWINDRCIEFTITDLPEGDHLSFRTDLSEMVSE